MPLRRALLHSVKGLLVLLLLHFLLHDLELVLDALVQVVASLVLLLIDVRLLFLALLIWLLRLLGGGVLDVLGPLRPGGFRLQVGAWPFALFPPFGVLARSRGLFLLLLGQSLPVSFELVLYSLVVDGHEDFLLFFGL